MSEENTALEIMKKLDNLYLKESSVLQICVRNKLDRMKQKDFEDSSSFFIEFEKTIYDLKNAGGKIDEREKFNYMLKTLPDSLSYIGDLVDALQESNKNCEVLKNKISIQESRNINNNSRRKKLIFFKLNRRKIKVALDVGNSDTSRRTAETLGLEKEAGEVEYIGEEMCETHNNNSNSGHNNSEATEAEMDSENTMAEAEELNSTITQQDSPFTYEEAINCNENHLVNEYYELKIIKIVKVDSENNIADILTKDLGPVINLNNFGQH